MSQADHVLTDAHLAILRLLAAGKRIYSWQRSAVDAQYPRWSIEHVAMVNGWLENTRQAANPEVVQALIAGGYAAVYNPTTWDKYTFQNLTLWNVLRLTEKGRSVLN